MADGADEQGTVEATAEEAGQRLDRFLADRMSISRARVRHLLEVGRVSLGDRVLTLSDKSHAAAAGERFEVAGALRAEDERPTPRPDLDLEIVSEGDGFVVVNKPAGVGVHPLRPDQEDTVLNALIARRPDIIGVGEGGLRSAVVHRLDVDTSGAVVFATHEASWKVIRGAFSDHRVDKRYQAIVARRFDRERRVDFPLEITTHQPAHVRVKDKGRRCLQHVRPLRIFANATLIEVKLETGFLHQIRASMAHLGHPVLGDREYFGDVPPPPFDIPRQMLHSTRIGMDAIFAEIQPPADFEEVLLKLAASEA